MLGRSRPVLRALPAFLVLALLSVPACSGGGPDTASTPPQLFQTLDQAMATGRLSPRLVEDLRTDGFADGLVTFRSLGEILDVVVGPDAAADPGAALQELRSRYDTIKDQLISVLGANAQVLEPYDYLPTALVRFRSLDVLLLTVNVPMVAGVTVPERRIATIKQSVPLIHADETRAAGDVGAGTYVAVLDTGVDFTRAAFGRCTAPGQPTTCKVPYARDYLFEDHSRDDNGHGTNVAGIVLAVAPGARILALDVFDEDPLPILGIECLGRGDHRRHQRHDASEGRGNERGGHEHEPWFQRLVRAAALHPQPGRRAQPVRARLPPGPGGGHPPGGGSRERRHDEGGCRRTGLHARRGQRGRGL